MAKAEKVTKQVAAPAEGEKQDKGAALEKARQARESAMAKDLFVYLGDPTKKIAPQAQTIVNAIKAAGEKGITRADLVQGLKGVLVTRQPEGRILSYYQKLIQEVGAVTIRQSAPEA